MVAHIKRYMEKLFLILLHCIAIGGGQNMVSEARSTESSVFPEFTVAHMELLTPAAITTTIGSQSTVDGSRVGGGGGESSNDAGAGEILETFEDQKQQDDYNNNDDDADKELQQHEKQQIDSNQPNDFSDYDEIGSSGGISIDPSIQNIQEVLQNIDPYIDLSPVVKKPNTEADSALVPNRFLYQKMNCEIIPSEVCQEFDIFCKRADGSAGPKLRQRCYSNPIYDSMFCKEALNYVTCSTKFASTGGRNTDELLQMLKKLLGYE